LNIRQRLLFRATVYIVLQQRWIDDYLTWEPNDYGGIRELIIPPSKIWLPDFGIENRSVIEIEVDLLSNNRIGPAACIHTCAVCKTTMHCRYLANL